jgi:aspartyl protease family protein
MEERGPYIIYYVVAAVFVASSLIGMRQPIGKTLKMALAWVAIFGVGFLLFSFRSEFSGVGQRLKAEAMGTPILDGQQIRIPIADDGHFWVAAKLNGRDVRFMVDSGASVTTVSRETAVMAGVPIGNEHVIVNTANGPARATKAYAEQLQIGSIEKTDFPIDINENDDTNLLGMNFLSSLQGWRVEGTYLVLQP